MKVNDRVSWIETYTTVGQVIAQRMVWGNVIEIVERPGDREGFAIKGTYLRVLPVGGGGSVFIYEGHVTSVVKA